MPKEEIKKEAKPEIKEFSLIQIPTQHELAFETPDGEVLTLYQAICLILNKIWNMEKKI